MTDAQLGMDSTKLLDHFRSLAVQDPRTARRELAELITAEPKRAEALMDQLSTPRDGRLRHLVATVARELKANNAVVPYLARWHPKETDEFTRRAIAVALAQVDDAPTQRAPPAVSTELYPPELAETYQFVASRLRHKLANGLVRAHTHLARLTAAVQAQQGAVAASIAIDGLKDEFGRLARSVEAVDVEPTHFSLRPIVLADWLREMNGRYASRFAAINLTLEGDLSPPAQIMASEYLLETIFWNVWMNAHEAAGRSCELSISVTRHDNAIRLLVADNGPGFPEKIRESAFRDQISTNSANRGRGLLEIDDATRRLHGEVRLAKDSAGEYRLLFVFPANRA